MDKAELKKYHKFGYTRFGPFLYGFVRWLKDELVRKGYDRIYFFSRDGYMMKKAFDLINGTGIETKYVYFSRKSLRTPLLCRCRDFEDSLKYLSRERFISVGKLLEYYGFDEAEREKLAHKYGAAVDTDIPFGKLKNSSLARRIYTDNRGKIDLRSKHQEELLLAYLKQNGMQGRFAVADIGWMGNMQYYLELFAEQNGIKTEPEGYYIGIERSAPVKSPMNGFLFDENDMRAKKKLICFYGGFEKLLQSFEGSTAGYERKADGSTVPVLMSYEYTENRQIIQAIKCWQNGALRYVEKANAADIRKSKEEFVRPLLSFGMHPSLKDTRLFSFFYNIDGSKVWYLPQKPLYRYRPKELVHALANSPWKTGFMKAAFKLPLPYHLIYRALKK